jgi:hypothetical protein
MPRRTNRSTPGGVDHGLEIGDEVVEGERVHIPVREPVAPLVVADGTVVAAQLSEPVPPDGTLPVELEGVEPVCHLDEGRALADGRPRDAHAVPGGAETDLLLDLAWIP